jgi:biofilm PGA synthesis lipoprotein PgaB
VATMISCPCEKLESFAFLPGLHLLLTLVVSITFLSCTQAPQSKVDTPSPAILTASTSVLINDALARYYEGKLTSSFNIFKHVLDNTESLSEKQFATSMIVKILCQQNKKDRAKGFLTGLLWANDEPNMRIFIRQQLEILEEKLRIEEPSATEQAKYQIKGVQLSVIQDPTWADFKERLDSLKSLGINTILIRAFHNLGDRYHKVVQRRDPPSSGVYFTTSNAPTIEDILGPATQIAHEKGMKIFAWMTTRCCDWQVEAHGYGGFKYNIDSRTIEFVHKLNILDPHVQKYLLALYVELAKYNLDGILFQDDLVYRYNEGFETVTKKLFEQETGLTISAEHLYPEMEQREDGSFRVSRYSPLFWKWTEWKNRKILAFVDTIVASVKQIHPNMLFILNMYYESIMDPDNGLAWLAQSFQEATIHNIDYFSLMAYHRQIQKEMRFSMDATHAFFKQMLNIVARLVDTPTTVIVKLQVQDWFKSEIIPPQELKTYMDVIGDGMGVIFFPNVFEIQRKVVRNYLFNGKKLEGN